jgi:hypothetical protein
MLIVTVVAVTAATVVPVNTTAGFDVHLTVMPGAMLFGAVPVLEKFSVVVPVALGRVVAALNRWSVKSSTFIPASTPALTGDEPNVKTVPPTGVIAVVVMMTEVVGGVTVTGTVGGTTPNV